MLLLSSWMLNFNTQRNEKITKREKDKQKATYWTEKKKWMLRKCKFRKYSVVEVSWMI